MEWFYKHKKTILVVVLIGGFLICNAPFIYLYFEGFISSIGIPDDTIEWGKFGQYGAFVDGVIGTFFSFLAAFLVFITYLHQVDSFKKQSEKIDESKERDYQRDFNNRFFNLIDLLGTTINSISIKDHPTVKGRSSFSILYDRYANIYSSFREKSKYSACYKKDAQQAWESFIEETNSYINPYIKTTLFILKEIEEYKGEKSYYSNLILCQLTNHELWILFFYYSFSDNVDKSVIDSNIELKKEFIDKKALCEEERNFIVIEK